MSRHVGASAVGTFALGLFLFSCSTFSSCPCISSRRHPTPRGPTRPRASGRSATAHRQKILWRRGESQRGQERRTDAADERGARRTAACVENLLYCALTFLLVLAARYYGLPRLAWAARRLPGGHPGRDRVPRLALRRGRRRGPGHRLDVAAARKTDRAGFLASPAGPGSQPLESHKRSGRRSPVKSFPFILVIVWFILGASAANDRGYFDQQAPRLRLRRQRAADRHRRPDQLPTCTLGPTASGARGGGRRRGAQRRGGHLTPLPQLLVGERGLAADPGLDPPQPAE